MKSIFAFFLIPLLFSCIAQKDKSAGTADQILWPEIEPYETGYLKVSDVHEIFYELCGNAEGKPAFMLHGGPGGSCSPAMRRMFNPEKYFIVLHDQRGAGRSKPYGEILDNTTLELVEDIERLRKHLGVEQMMLAGGSWGSTLALAYAETYPERVTEMVLRGIWTATREEVDWFYHGGAATVFPDVYDEFLRSLPDPTARPLPPYLVNLLSSADTTLVRRIAGAWMRYEWRISDIDVDTAEVNEWIRHNDSFAFGMIENQYMANGCFLQEGQLWDHLERIRHIPTVIINGRFDMPCPVRTAYRLHQELPRSRIVIVENGGHGGWPVIRAETEAIRSLEP
ncbi:MAG: prolyl aminopeptidase [Bacteroidales bacterium]|nr:prolyl aminopeptidase [Bacteroidales bacterium]